MKRQAAIIASTIFAFALVAVLISADKIPIGVVTVVNGTGGGNLTVSGTGGTDQLLTWDTDTTGHWTSGISSFGVTNLAVLSSMSINITNQILATDGSGNVVGGGDPFVWTSQLADNATNVAMVVDTANTWTDPAAQIFSFRNSGQELLGLTGLGTFNLTLNVPADGTDGTADAEGFQPVLYNNGFTGSYANAIFAQNYLPPNGAFEMLHNKDGITGLNSVVGFSSGGGVTNGSAAAIFGEAFGAYSFQYGVIGNCVEWGDNGQTNIGVAASVVGGNIDGTVRGKAVALYADISSDLHGEAHVTESSIALLEARDSGFPLLIARTNNSAKVFVLANDGSTFSASTNFANYVYVTNDCSALTFTDRSRSPSSLSDAYRIVQSHATKNGKVDHDKLDKLAQGRTKDTRDLGMVISAQEMVIQDLLTRIEKLEKK